MATQEQVAAGRRLGIYVSHLPEEDARDYIKAEKKRRGRIAAQNAIARRVAQPGGQTSLERLIARGLRVGCEVVVKQHAEDRKGLAEKTRCLVLEITPDNKLRLQAPPPSNGIFLLPPTAVYVPISRSKAGPPRAR